MTNTTIDTELRELDQRSSDGIDVRLMWHSATDQIVVAVRDARTDDSFEFQVVAAEALDAFHHPYVYANFQHAGYLVAR